MTHPQIPKGGKLEKRSRVGANDSFRNSKNAKKRKANKVTKIVETATPISMALREVEPQKEPGKYGPNFAERRTRRAKGDCLN